VVAAPGRRPGRRHRDLVGVKDGYFVDDEEAETFRAELKHLIIHQMAAFNSPVWFNIGVAGVPQQGSACFILSVDDTMDSILNWYTEEGVIFKGGSGAGVNLSRIPLLHEFLKGGGTASGPVSLCGVPTPRPGPSSPGARPGGPPNMVILDSTIPTSRTSSVCKAIEERKAGSCATPASTWTRREGLHQPAVTRTPTTRWRVTDEFMEAVVDGREWALTAGTKEKSPSAGCRPATCSARSPRPPGRRRPGHAVRHHHQQVDTASTPGADQRSNPCSEYMHIDDSACNLAAST